MTAMSQKPQSDDTSGGVCRAVTDEELDALVTRLDEMSDLSRDHAAGLLDIGHKVAVHQAITAITTLRAQLAEAHTRIEAMESGDWSELKLVRFENGQMDITAGPIPAIAEYLAQMMQDGEGKYFNFMEVSINHNTAGPMTLSLQRKNGKTPNQLRKEAEARAEAERAAQIEADAGVIDSITAEASSGIFLGSAQDRAVLEMMKSLSNAIRNQPHDRTALDAAIRAAKVEAWKEAADLAMSAGNECDVSEGRMVGFDIYSDIIALIEREGV